MIICILDLILPGQNKHQQLDYRWLINVVIIRRRHFVDQVGYTKEYTSRLIKSYYDQCNGWTHIIRTEEPSLQIIRDSLKSIMHAQGARYALINMLKYALFL